MKRAIQEKAALYSKDKTKPCDLIDYSTRCVDCPCRHTEEGAGGEIRIDPKEQAESEISHHELCEHPPLFFASESSGFTSLWG